MKHNHKISIKKLWIFALLGLWFLFKPKVTNTLEASQQKQRNLPAIMKREQTELSTVAVDTPKLPTAINYEPQGSYTNLKSKIKKRQAYYQAQATDTIPLEVLNSARQEITSLLLQEIFPHWYGTAWDFNGYTAVPNHGEVACGYLVSTTLRDVGFRLNRYHMAQQASYYAAISLQKKKQLITYRNVDVVALKHLLLNERKLKSGLYFVGLDNHVGYLLIHDKNLYFIHSNYIEDRVMIEEAARSLAFESSIYVIADITYNDALITKWIRNEVIVIKRGKG